MLEEYFVLYVKHDLDGTEVELPVSVTLGQDGTTTLAENVEALPPRRSGAGASPWAAWAVTTRRSGTSTGPWS